MLRVLQIPGIAPQRGYHLFGRTGPALAVHQIGEQFFGLPSCENQGLSLPKHFEVSETLNPQPALLGGGWQRFQLRSHPLRRQGFDYISLRAYLKSIQSVLGKGRNEYDPRARGYRPERDGKFQSVNARHFNGTEYDIRGQAFGTDGIHRVCSPFKAHELCFRLGFAYGLFRIAQHRRLVIYGKDQHIVPFVVQP